MKKILSTALMLSLICGFFSCEHQGGKQTDRKKNHKQTDRSQTRRNMLSQQALPSSSAQQQINQ